MDSGNSGSFQSSSGDDEFDSHANGISSLLNNNPAPDHVVVAHSNHHQQPPPPPPTTVSSYIYQNPLSNYFDLVSPPQPLPNHPNSNNTLLINSNSVDWLKTLRSETEIWPFQVENTTVPTTIVSPPPQPSPPGVGKNPRKRSRASRRAPTTVLTTDTSNFRAMVQEFTGIPAPPFSSSPSLTNQRFDLFSRASSNMRYTEPYVCRPFPQKVQLGSSINNTLGLNINANNYYQCPPQTSTHFNLPNPNPFVSSFLETNTNRFPPTTKSHQESLDVNTNTHQNLIFSDFNTTSRNNNQDGVSWGVHSSQDDDQSNFHFSS